ncbi:hypothetical protein Tco_1555030 [Tanacetum coccineum]
MMHTSKDDYLINTLRFVCAIEETQIYGAILPESLTSSEMKETKAYKTYLGFTIGATTLKKARKFKKPVSPKLTTVPVSTEEPTRKSKRVKRPAKKSTKALARGKDKCKNHGNQDNSSQGQINQRNSKVKCMRTRFLLETSIPRRRNRRRSRQQQKAIPIVDKYPIQMADDRPMAEQLQAPTGGPNYNSGSELSYTPWPPIPPPLFDEKESLTEKETEVTKDKVLPSTKDIQPPVIQKSHDQIKPVSSPISPEPSSAQVNNSPPLKEPSKETHLPYPQRMKAQKTKI